MKKEMEAVKDICCTCGKPITTNYLVGAPDYRNRGINFVYHLECKKEYEIFINQIKMAEEKKNPVTSVVNYIDSLKPLVLAADPKVEKKFISVFNAIHGTQTGESIYESEKFYFQKIVSESKELMECSSMSLYGAFITLAVDGTSLDPHKKMAYLMWRNKETFKGSGKWGKEAYLAYQALGEVALRIRCGQVKYVDNVIVIHKGDFYEEGEQDGKRFVNYKNHHPRTSEEIDLCFVKITRFDGSTDYVKLTLADMRRLEGFSETQNGGPGKGNKLYKSGFKGQPDVSFWKTKTIKHAFKSYPEVKPSTKYSEIEKEEDEFKKPEINLDIDETVETPYEEIKSEAPETNGTNVVEPKPEVKMEPNPEIKSERKAPPVF